MTYLMMPDTAEQAHRVARSAYRDMLQCLASGELLQAGTQSEIFRNAAALAQMYEARQTRLALLELLGRARASDVDSHELHAAAPNVPYDGFAVNGRSR